MLAIIVGIIAVFIFGLLVFGEFIDVLRGCAILFRKLPGKWIWLMLAILLAVLIVAMQLRLETSDRTRQIFSMIGSGFTLFLIIHGVYRRIHKKHR